jgi:hypothetical protein
MHEDTACRVVPWSSVSVGTGNTDARLAERLDIVPLIAEFRGVVQYQERPVGCRCTISGRLEMSCQDTGLVNRKRSINPTLLRFP